jgi:hypothetical protein
MDTYVVDVSQLRRTVLPKLFSLVSAAVSAVDSAVSGAVAAIEELYELSGAAWLARLVASSAACSVSGKMHACLKQGAMSVTGRRRGAIS